MNRFISTILVLLFLTTGSQVFAAYEKNVPLEDKKAVAATAENKEAAEKKEEQFNTAGSEFVKGATSPGLHTSKIMMFGGTHKRLYGYTDERYVAYDKGDYVKTDAYWGGLEFFMTNFSNAHPKLENIRFGMNINYYYQKEYTQRYLYAVPGYYIDDRWVPSKPSSYSKFILIPGAFLGIDKKWFGLDAGVTFVLKARNEKSRLINDPTSDPENPVIIEKEGRGYVWDDNSVKMNFLVRLGLESSANFTVGIYREDYNPDYGVLQTKLSFPIVSFFTMKVGGYLFKTQSIFIEPVFSVFGVSLGVKAGSIINYHEDDFNKVGIKDGIFYSGYLSYGWN